MKLCYILCSVFVLPILISAVPSCPLNNIISIDRFLVKYNCLSEPIRCSCLHSENCCIYKGVGLCLNNGVLSRPNCALD